MGTVEGIRAEGCGNAYFFVDAQRVGATATADVCTRVGSEIGGWLAQLSGARLDGLILLEPDAESIWRLTVWNADGSRGEVCGNGLRAAALLARRAFGVAQGTLASDAGRHVFHITSDGHPARVSVTLPPPRFEPAQIPLATAAARLVEGSGNAPRHVWLDVGEHVVEGYAVSVGNPHFVVPCRAPLVGPLVDGPALERHAAFPARVNASWIWPLGPARIGLRTFERGSGETAACGSGACAAAVVAQHQGWVSARVDVEQPGGVLSVELGRDELALIGPASMGALEQIEI